MNRVIPSNAVIAGMLAVIASFASPSARAQEPRELLATRISKDNERSSKVGSAGAPAGIVAVAKPTLLFVDGCRARNRRGIEAAAAALAGGGAGGSRSRTTSPAATAGGGLGADNRADQRHHSD